MNRHRATGLTPGVLNELLVHDRTPSQDPGENRQDWTKVRETYQCQVDRALAFSDPGRYRTLDSAIVTRLVLQSRNQRLDSDQRMARAGVSLFHNLAAFRDQTEVENRLKAEERSRFAKSLTRPTGETASMFHTPRMFAFRKGHASRRRPIHRKCELESLERRVLLSSSSIWARSAVRAVRPNPINRSQSASIARPAQPSTPAPRYW